MSMFFRSSSSSGSRVLRSLITSSVSSSSAPRSATLAVRPFSISSLLQDSRERFGTSPVSKTLFVGGLSWDTTSDELRDAFMTKYGDSVSSTKIIYDREKERSKGFGYVEFKDEEAAAQAKEEMHDEILGGRRLRLDFAAERPPNAVSGGRGEGGRGMRDTESFSAREASPAPTLFFGNLPNALTTEELEDILVQELGDGITIKEIRFPMGRADAIFPGGNAEEMNNKGFGYVELGSTEQATEVMETLRQKISDEDWSLDGRVPRIGYEQPRKETRGVGGGGRGGFGSDRRGGGGGGGRGGYGGGYGSRDNDRNDRGGRDRYSGGRSDRFSGGGGRGGRGRSDYDL